MTLVGPVNGSVGSAIVVGKKGQDLGSQLLHGSTTESAKQTTDEDAEPNLNVVEPGVAERSLPRYFREAVLAPQGCCFALQLTM
jgi:hypothetical protein